MKLYINRINLKPNSNLKNHHFYFQKNPNILTFKDKSRLLSEKDMINLFLGFIRLVKKSVSYEIEEAYRKKLKYYHNQIKNLKSLIKD